MDKRMYWLAYLFHRKLLFPARTYAYGLPHTSAWSNKPVSRLKVMGILFLRRNFLSGPPITSFRDPACLAAFLPFDQVYGKF